MKPGSVTKASFAAGAAGVLLLGACVGTGVNTYDEFRSAIEGGADCAQLFEMRGNFESTRDLERIDADLESLGCEDADSTRSDS